MDKRTNNDTPITTELYIDGEIRPAEGERHYNLYNPARPDELVGHAALASPKDVDTAVEASHRAFPLWSGKSYTERAVMLNHIADQLVVDKEDLAFRSRLFCREHGKILKETMLEVSRLGDRFRQAAAYADRLEADEKVSGGPFDTIITRQRRNDLDEQE